MGDDATHQGERAKHSPRITPSTCPKAILAAVTTGDPSSRHFLHNAAAGLQDMEDRLAHLRGARPVKLPGQVTVKFLGHFLKHGPPFGKAAQGTET